MTPEQVAGHVMLTDLHNDLHVIGPFILGDGERTAVRIYLDNGYGVSLATDIYGEGYFPSVAPIKKITESGEEFRFAFEVHPDFSTTLDSETDCTSDRVHEILSQLKNLTENT